MTTDHYPPKFGPGQIAQTSPNFRFCFVKRADLKKSSPKDFILSFLMSSHQVVCIGMPPYTAVVYLAQGTGLN